MTAFGAALIDGNQIQKGQTLNSGELSQRTDHWYVTADNGDMVVRVVPGLSLGETETGELSLDGGDAMLSLSIGRDDLLVAFALGGSALASEGGEFSGRRHLAFNSAATITLPNNTLRFDRGIISDAKTDASLLTRAVWQATGAESPGPSKAHDSIKDSPKSSPKDTIDTGSTRSATEPKSPQASAPLPDEPHSKSAPAQAKNQPPPQNPVPNKSRKKALFAAASAGLACVLVGLFYTGTLTPLMPKQPVPNEQQVAAADTSNQTEEAGGVAEQIADVVAEKATETAVVDVEPLLETNKGPAEPTAEPTAGGAAAAPEIKVVIDIPPSDLAAANTTQAPAVIPAKPLSQNRPPPVVAETPVRAPVKAPARAPARVVDESAAEIAAQREQEQAQTALVMYERDLLAAELALIQGRLTQPPEDSAFALYRKLVALNPESSEARRGFQAVGAALVNRAFAEVAAKRWGDAQATLAAAAEAGASPNLVADLRGEVSYQQRLADAEAGSFAALYPAADLVALNRTTPSLRRYAPEGIDMVQIEFTISVAGSVQDIEVLGAPPQQLERMVRQAVTDWRFEPVLSGTRPIPVRTRVGLEIP